MEHYFQQGDTLYFKSEIPKEAAEDKKFDGIVQHGEATGHAHRLHGDGFKMYQTSDNRRFLRLLSTVPLRHEEHDEIKLPSGDYEVRIVREKNHFDDLIAPVVD